MNIKQSEASAGKDNSILNIASVSKMYVTVSVMQLVERVSGMSFSEYLKENINKPFSMNNTGTLWDTDFNRQVPVYINGNVKLASQIPQLIGCGGIMSDAKDVCTFGSAFFAGNDILLSEKEDYAKVGVKVLTKGGDTSQHAGLVVAPDRKISVAVLSSGGSSSNCEEICLDLLDAALKEQGITVEHPESKSPEFISTVPDELKYSSYIPQYGDSVSLPECGMIVFIGETGSTVHIGR